MPRFSYQKTIRGFVEIRDNEQPGPPVILTPQTAKLLLDDIEAMRADGAFVDNQHYLAMRDKYQGALFVALNSQHD